MTRRRWFLRVTSLTLLILCLGAWGWSLVSNDVIQYVGDEELGAELADGCITVYQMSPGLFMPSEGTHFYHNDDHLRSELSTVHISSPWFGFKFHRSLPFYKARGLVLVTVPLWFPTLLLTALTAWSWRKRRTEGARGFAVEGAGEKAADNAAG